MTTQPTPFDTLNASLMDSWVRLKNQRTGQVVGQSADEVLVQFQDHKKPVAYPIADVAVVPSAARTDAASRAAGRALAGDADGLQHLMAICWKAVGSLRYPTRVPPWKPWTEWTPADECRRLTKTERARTARTAAFIESFLAEELHPHLGKPPAERRMAVNAGDFQYIGRRCRNRLIDAVRKEYKKKRDPLDSARSIDAPMSSGDSFSEMLAAPPSTAVQQDELFSHLAEDREALIAEGGEQWYGALVLLANLYPEIKKGDAVRAVAKAFGVSDRQARNEVPHLIRRAWANLKRHHSATRRLYELLEASAKAD